MGPKFDLIAKKLKCYVCLLWRFAISLERGQIFLVHFLDSLIYHCLPLVLTNSLPQVNESHRFSVLHSCWKCLARWDFIWWFVGEFVYDQIYNGQIWGPLNRCAIQDGTVCSIIAISKGLLNLLWIGDVAVTSLCLILKLVKLLNIEFDLRVVRIVEQGVLR